MRYLRRQGAGSVCDDPCTEKDDVLFQPGSGTEGGGHSTAVLAVWSISCASSRTVAHLLGRWDAMSDDGLSRMCLAFSGTQAIGAFRMSRRCRDEVRMVFESRNIFVSAYPAPRR
jgi:hypothetical protein